MRTFWNKLRGRVGAGGTTTLYRTFRGVVWQKEIQWDSKGKTTKVCKTRKDNF